MRGDEPLVMLIESSAILVELSGELAPGATATDLVLTITEMLRKVGVVNKFVEFAGDGLASVALADRATIANMAPEYGATTGIFPIDEETLNYLRLTGRSDDQIAVALRHRFAYDRVMTDDLQKLLEAAKAANPTPEHRELQRRSFVYGNTHFENELITREMVDREAESLAKDEK